MTCARRLWMLNHHAMSPDMVGGTRHYDLGQKLVERGWDVTIFASSFHHSLRQELRLQDGREWAFEEFDGVKFVWLRTWPYQRNDWRRVASMFDYLRRVFVVGLKVSRAEPRVPRPDVVLGSSVHLLAPVGGWLLAQRFRCPFVMEVRDLWPQTMVDMGMLTERHPVTLALRGLETFLYRQAARIVVLPPDAGDYVAGLGIPREKLLFIPNGVDTARFEGVAAAPATPGKLTAMYTGAHGETNGLELVLDVAAELKARGEGGLEFVFVGDGPVKPQLVERARAEGLDNVVFRDPVPKRRIPELLASADVLLHIEKGIPELAKFGGSPNKLVDYMAAGKPVIVSSGFVRLPITERGAGLLLPPDDRAAFRDALLEVKAMSAAERREMGTRAHAYVRETYDTGILAGRLEQALLEVCGAGNQA